MNWFYGKDGQQQGPASTEELVTLIRNGELPPASIVWTEGMDDWKPFEEVDIIKDALMGPKSEPLTSPASVNTPEPEPTPSTSIAETIPEEPSPQVEPAVESAAIAKPDLSKPDLSPSKDTASIEKPDLSSSANSRKDSESKMSSDPATKSTFKTTMPGPATGAGPAVTTPISALKNKDADSSDEDPDGKKASSGKAGLLSKLPFGKK